MEIRKKYFLILLIFFSSCSTFEKSEKISEILDLIRGSNQELKTFSKEEIYNLNYPIIEVRTNGLVKQALMLPITSRYNFTNYISGTGPMITMNGPIITKTNGMNTFLNSVEVSEDYPLLNLRKIIDFDHIFKKTYIFLTSTYESKIISFECKFSDEGQETLTVLEEEIVAIKMLETCKRDNKSFINMYWVQEGGLVIKSKQLISESEVFVTLTVLKS